ncbi:immunoglobulin superfamily member 10-like isoform X2 [Perca flavescens]|uniref:immunoglobulin superfamily member 10-like isoform X2 n=1 Tax=Perca flavescens TaxID=8167 RepID=UPI00106EC38F|nr:immunoglobulin superfamily member 10-like isoform X2 [Perca flavescens]
MEVPGLPGDKAILRCQTDDSSISAVEWSRADLKSGNILSYREGWLVPGYPHPDYKEDKVQLVDRDLKKGNMSLVLRNVSTYDKGTYECRVTSRGSRWKNIPFLPSEPIRIIHLQVTERDPIEVTVHPGDDVILPFKADHFSISIVEWSRPDLKPDNVLLYYDGDLYPNQQHRSFKDRVELVDTELEDGDVSLLLKNVNKNDRGTYKCRVTVAGSEGNDPYFTSGPIRIIHLQVTEPDLIVVTVRPGDDVILPCQAADPSIRAVEWSRPDLKPDIVLLYNDGDLETDNQHPSFKGRVKLVDRDLKDGDVSLTLKNVNIHENGTYKCRVKTGDSDLFRTIRIIRLQVADEIVVTVDPGDDAILPCQAADPYISAVEWRRVDPKPDIVLLSSDGFIAVHDLNPPFKDGVKLVKRKLKDGNASIILKNVSFDHTGTYECRVSTDGSKRTNIDSEPIRIIRLQVVDMSLVKVRPGQNAILPCRAADLSINAVVWSRADLTPDEILSYRNVPVKVNQPDNQHPSFKDRVELVDTDLKNGNVSLELKKVNRHDDGTYECRVETVDENGIKKGLDSDPIGIVRLQVVVSGIY